jgi:hypothetical protein
MNKDWIRTQDDNFLAIMLNGWQKALDDAYRNKDLVFGTHAQQVVEMIKEVIAERKAAN